MSENTQNAATVGKVAWFEIMGQDATKLRAFYADVFGWRIEGRQTPMGEYGFTQCEQTGVPGGIGAAPEGPGWAIFYVQVDDVAATVARTVELGGAVVVPPTQLPDTRIAIIRDPEGHTLGISSQ